MSELPKKIKHTSSFEQRFSDRVDLVLSPFSLEEFVRAKRKKVGTLNQASAKVACSQTLFIYEMTKITFRHVINKQRLRAGYTAKASLLSFARNVKLFY